MARDFTRLSAIAWALPLGLGVLLGPARPSSAAHAPSELQAAPDRIREIISGLDAWSAPQVDERAAVAACVKSPPSSLGQTPMLPEDEIKKLEDIFAGTRQGVDFLCGKTPSCSSPSADQSLGPLQCALADKLEFMRALFGSRADIASCKRRAMREVPWAKSIPDSSWPEVCRQLADAILHDNMALCAPDGILGRLPNGSEALADCRETLAFLKGSEACSVSRGPHRKGSIGPRDADECRIAAQSRAALSSRDPRRCEGEPLCLAAMKDPSMCAVGYKPPSAADIMLAGDASGCAGGARCLKLHESAEVFRRNNADGAEQLRRACTMSVNRDLVRIRSDRLAVLEKAHKEVTSLGRSRGFSDQALLQRAMSRLEELTRQASAMPPASAPLGAGSTAAPPGMRADGPLQGFGGAGNRKR